MIHPSNANSTQRSLSPINKDPQKIGKLFTKAKEISLVNPEQQMKSLSIVQQKSLGINTSRIGLLYASEVEIIHEKEESEEVSKPVSQFKLHSSVYDLNLAKNVKPKDKSEVKKDEVNSLIHEDLRKVKDRLERSPIGTIRKQARSAPKESKIEPSETSLFLPSINKIEKNERNVQGLKSFVVSAKSAGNSSSEFKRVNKNKSAFYHESFNMDPEENQALQNRSFRISNSRVKLPTFKDQSKNQYDENSRRKNENYSIPRNQEQELQIIEESEPLDSSRNNLQQSYINTYMPAKTQSSLKNTTNHFITNHHCPNSESLLIVDLRTSISKIKQTLVESQSELFVSFVVPEIFFTPPSASSTSQELHMLMLEVFSHVGINPQIVSIKKYVNCVVLREKNLCINWNFNGKIYFGGWQRGNNLSEGNKNGVGIEWVPSRYIYYGEFKDNKKEGYGIMKKSNKQVYLGEWKNNQRWGWGKLFDTEGQLHQNGEFVEGCFVADQTEIQRNL